MYRGWGGLAKRVYDVAVVGDEAYIQYLILKWERSKLEDSIYRPTNYFYR